jgi:two-component system LytT family response regulator
MNYSAIIIDDEKNAIDTIEILLNNQFPQINICAKAKRIEEAVEAILRDKPDIVFLDIELKEGSGFEIAERTMDVPYQLIFTTAYPNFAINAFKVNAIDYLLKPIDSEEFNAAVKKAINQIDVDRINSSNKEKSSDNQRVELPTNDGIVYLSPDEIIRVEADSNYTRIFTNDEKVLLLSKTLKEIETKLKHENFIRVHKSHIINLLFLAKYIKGDGGMIILKNKEQIPVSRAKKDELVSKLKSISG